MEALRASLNRFRLWKAALRLVGNARAWGAALIVCWSAVSYSANVQPRDRDYPQQNPLPTKFLLIRGTIDPSLTIHFNIAWQAENPQCQYTVSRLAGAYAQYSAGGPLAIARDGAVFSARVPIDGVLPGRCKWRFGGVSFAGPTGYYTPLIMTNSYPLKPGQSPNGVAELHCKWISIASPGFTNPNLDCRWPRSEDPNASVLGGKLWWHSEASELEVHFFAD
jgi:hypothetical protein